MGEEDEETGSGSATPGDGRSDPLGDATGQGDRGGGGGDESRDSRVGDRASDDQPPDDPDQAPLDELATSVDERRDRQRERPDDELFTEEDVEAIDTDAVWDQLDGDESDEPTSQEREVRVVEKDAYCEGCPHFTRPPEVSCAHEGTEILELVDMDHFRVVDCPKVRETERLEQL